MVCWDTKRAQTACGIRNPISKISIWNVGKVKEQGCRKTKG